MNDDELKAIKKLFKGQIPVHGLVHDPFKINYEPNEAEKATKSC